MVLEASRARFDTRLGRYSFRLVSEWKKPIRKNEKCGCSAIGAVV